MPADLTTLFDVRTVVIIFSMYYYYYFFFLISGRSGFFLRGRRRRPPWVSSKPVRRPDHRQDLPGVRSHSFIIFYIKIHVVYLGVCKYNIIYIHITYSSSTYYRVILHMGCTHSIYII
jgi:hypothetical protein